MSILGLEKTPVGPIGRGLELQGQSRAGRAFIRWESHFAYLNSDGQPQEDISALITATGCFPPQEKMWRGVEWSRQDFDPCLFKVWYRR